MLVTLLFLAVVSVMAQTNVPPVLPGIPQSAGAIWDAAIAGVAPIIVWLVRKIIPKIPTMLLPMITPVIGIGLGLLLNRFANADLSWFDMAKAGALAVFVRETVNQAITKQLEPAKPAPTG